jgi:HSP20 family protein
MAVIRWRPFSEMSNLQREMNRMFDSFMRMPDEEEGFRGTWSPEIDIKETADAIVIQADLPGMKKDEIKLQIRDNTLQISGEKKMQEEKKGETYHRVERVYGSFRRTFTLPTMVDSSKIQAIYKDGVLHLTLPKSEESKPKEIQIKGD